MFHLQVAPTAPALPLQAGCSRQEIQCRARIIHGLRFVQAFVQLEGALPLG